MSKAQDKGCWEEGREKPRRFVGGCARFGAYHRRKKGFYTRKGLSGGAVRPLAVRGRTRKGKSRHCLHLCKEEEKFGQIEFGKSYQEKDGD